MADFSSGRARQPKRGGPERPFQQHKPRGDKPRGKPHPRTVHELDLRQAAFETLRRLKPGELLEPAAFATIRHHGADARLVARILPMIEDATRWAILSDYLISHVATRKPEDLDDDVRAALHLFIAWLIEDPKAGYAHGNATVELLSQTHKGRGFLNACVRRLSELLQVGIEPAEDYTALAKAHEAPRLSASKVRVGGGRVVTSQKPLFPSPEGEIAQHLSIAGSVPLLMAQKLLEQYGPQPATQAAIACMETPLTWLRPNPLHAGWRHIADFWERRSVRVVKLPVGDPDDEVFALGLPADTRVTEHPDFNGGAFYVQDYSSQLVAPMLGAKPDEAILDLCAAPGGKAAHLAELTGDRARILACDLTEPKMERIRDNLARMGYRSIATVQADATSVTFPEKFDRILIDAPCSNSGVLARRIEARHRINGDTLRELATLQLKILENATRNLKPGGVIVYNVCSILMEEGVDVLHKFMSTKTGGQNREDAGWEVQQEVFTLPVPALHDGAYCVRLRSPA